MALTAFVVLSYLAVLLLYFLSSAERFPILATLLIIATTLCWTFSGISFFLDLYRVPVFTSFLIVMMFPRLFNIERDTRSTMSPPSPARIFSKANPRLSFPNPVNSSRPLSLRTLTATAH